MQQVMFGNVPHTADEVHMMHMNVQLNAEQGVTLCLMALFA